MANRFLNIASVTSAAVLVSCIILWLAADGVDPRQHHLSFGRHCNLSVTRSDLDGRLQIFNDAAYGPYSGSIIAISSFPRKPPPTYSSFEFGDTAGIYIRSFTFFADGARLWTVSVSLYYPMALSAVLPMVWCLRRRKRSHRGFPIRVEATVAYPDRRPAEWPSIGERD